MNEEKKLKASECDGGVLLFRENLPELKYERIRLGKLRKTLSNIQMKDVELKKKLGKGSYGHVYLCKAPNLEEDLVIKIFSENLVTTSQKKKEEVIGRDGLYFPYHPNVVTILCSRFDEVFDRNRIPDGENRRWENVGKIIHTPVIIMKHHKWDLRRFMSERIGIWISEVFEILRGVLRGCEHLHRHMIVHRDLHPGNIFVDDDRVYVGDFGCALDLRTNLGGFVVRSDDEIMFSLCSSTFEWKAGGVTGYLPPEIREKKEEIEKMKENGEYEGECEIDYEKSDVFSIGMIGKYLMGKIHMEEKQNQQFTFLSLFVEKLLCADPQKRMDFRESFEYVGEFENYGREEDKVFGKR